MNTVKCPECHTENRFDNKSCSNCGAPLAVEAPGSADSDWLSDLSEMIASVQANEEEALAPEGLPDWLEASQPEEEAPADKDSDDLLAWLRDIRPMRVSGAGEEMVDEGLPEWLELATGSFQADVPTLPGDGSEESQSTEIGAGPIDEESRTAGETPEEPLPQWLSELTSSKDWADTVDDTVVADWEMDDEATEGSPSEALPLTQPLNPTKELRGVPRQIASESLPEWLSDQIEEISEEPATDADALYYADGLIDAADAVQVERVEFERDSNLEDEVAGPATVAAGRPDAMPPPPGDEWLALLDDASASAEDDAELAMAEDSSPDAMQVLDADIPEWLLALKPGVSIEAAGTTTMTEEESGPLAGLRGVIPVTPTIAGLARASQATPHVESKEQQRQIALLKQLTAVDSEPDDRASEHSSGALFAVSRIFIASALLIFAALGWLLPSLGVSLPLPAPSEVPEAAREAYDTVNNVAGQPALVAFEYTPALAGELDAVAGTLLRHLTDNGSPVITVSQSAAGSAVADRAVANIEGLESESLGFVAGEAVGLRQLAECLEDSSACQLLSNRPADDTMRFGLEEISLIVVLAGERDGLSNWIEQVGERTESVMVAGVAQQLGPVVAPYHASEQLSGYLNGVPAAAAYEQRLRGNEEYAAEWLTSLTLVQWLVIAVLVVGSLYFGLMGLVPGGARKAKT
jgi:hypothetical protein